MMIKVKRKLRHPDAPQRHEYHRRPMTRSTRVMRS